MDELELHVKKTFYCSFIVQAAGFETAYRPFVSPYGDYSYLLCSLAKINTRRKKMLFYYIESSHLTLQRMKTKCIIALLKIL